MECSLRSLTVNFALLLFFVEWLYVWRRRKSFMNHEIISLSSRLFFSLWYAFDMSYTRVKLKRDNWHEKQNLRIRNHWGFSARSLAHFSSFNNHYRLWLYFFRKSWNRRKQESKGVCYEITLTWPFSLTSLSFWNVFLTLFSLSIHFSSSFSLLSLIQQIITRRVTYQLLLEDLKEKRESMTTTRLTVFLFKTLFKWRRDRRNWKEERKRKKNKRKNNT